MEQDVHLNFMEDVIMPWHRTAAVLFCTSLYNSRRMQRTILVTKVYMCIYTLVKKRDPKLLNLHVQIGFRFIHEPKDQSEAVLYGFLDLHTIGASEVVNQSLIPARKGSKIRESNVGHMDGYHT